MDRDERSRLIGVIEEMQTREQRNRATHSWNPEGGETLECLACGVDSVESAATWPCPDDEDTDNEQQFDRWADKVREIMSLEPGAAMQQLSTQPQRNLVLFSYAALGLLHDVHNQLHAAYERDDDEVPPPR
jgi:hypothetical protein